MSDAPKLIDHMERESFEVNEALGIDRHSSQRVRMKAIASLRAENERLRRDSEENYRLAHLMRGAISVSNSRLSAIRRLVSSVGEMARGAEDGWAPVTDRAAYYKPLARAILEIEEELK